MHRRITFLAALLACAAALAQPAPQESQPVEGRKNQKAERLHHEDSRAIIDEVRYGGETQSITVQPKGNMPEYEIQPTDMARSRPGDNRDGISNSNGRRVWNVFRF